MQFFSTLTVKKSLTPPPSILLETKDNGLLNEGLSLGLYLEDGKHNSKPVFKQIDGDFLMLFTSENKWILRKEKSQDEEEEIFIQINPKLPELTSDKWKYPSHKVSVVHTIPCCKTITVKNISKQGKSTYS